MINLCLVVIATQFSETKRRETERMIAERRRFSRSSSSNINSSSDADPGSCWEELLKFLARLTRRAYRKIIKKYEQNKSKKSANVIFSYFYLFIFNERKTFLGFGKKNRDLLVA